MYSFLRRPIWILSHVLILGLIVVMVSLGFWQRSRYYEEKGKKEKLEAAAAATPVPIERAVDTSTESDEVPATVKYRRVEVSGVFDESNEVIVNNRSLDGAPGGWVLTPLVMGDGRVVAVVRGWIPLSLAEKGVPVSGALPPEGTVAVTGVLQLTQTRESFGPEDPTSGRLSHLSRVDLARFASQLPYGIEPVWVLLDGQSPAQNGDLPQLVSLQPNDPSQNLSYMFQWWIFASIAIIGYPLVLRMVARGRSVDSPGRRRRMDDEIPWAEGLGPEGTLTPESGSRPAGDRSAGDRSSGSIDRGSSP